MANNGYIGKIGHGGTQVVKAPNPGSDSKASGTVHKGGDLRNKK